MNEHEAQKIAAAMHVVRPDWPASSVLTLIRKNLINRPRRDVFVALAWIASETNTATPARVLEQGPWWKAAGVDGTTSPQREPFDRGGCCHTCSLPYEKCRRLWADDHDYVSVAEYAKTATSDPERIRRILQAVKAEKVPMREPAKPREADPPQLDHEHCEQAINDELAKGHEGKAEFLAELCDRRHGDQTDA